MKLLQQLGFVTTLPDNALLVNGVVIKCDYNNTGKPLFEAMKKLQSVPETIVYANAEAIKIHPSKGARKEITPTAKGTPNVYIINITSQQAYDRMLLTFDPNRPIAILNFANAAQLGSSALFQTTPQEQGLMHKFPPVFASYLHYMETHKKRDGKYLVGNEIAVTEISPHVFMLAGAMPDLTTRSAPTEDEYVAKIKNLIEIAAALGITQLILGAWGCGVFGNKPETVAAAFKKAIDETNVEMTITFAVPGSQDDGSIYQIFQKELEAKNYLTKANEPA